MKRIFGRIVRSLILNLTIVLLLLLSWCHSSVEKLQDFTKIDPPKMIGVELPISGYILAEDNSIISNEDLGQKIIFRINSLEKTLFTNKPVAIGTITNVEAVGPYKDCVLIRVDPKDLSMFTLDWQCGERVVVEKLIGVRFSNRNYDHFILPKESP